MANTLLTPDIIAKEAALVLESIVLMKDLVHTDHSSEFGGVGEVVNVRVPATLLGKRFKGQITRQNITEGKIPVKLDRIVSIDTEIGSKELTLDLNSFSEQVIKPAMRGLAQRQDQDLHDYAYAYAKGSVVAKEGATNLEDIANVALYLDTIKAPTDERRLVLSPTHKYRYALKDNLSNVAYAGTNETLRDALLGRLYTLDTYMSQNVAHSLAPTPGTATAYKIESASNGEVKLSGVTPATGTVKIGDGFVHNGITYRFAEDGTATAGAIATIKVEDEEGDGFPSGVSTAIDVVPFVKNASVAFHRHAFTLATRPLEKPMGAAQSAVATTDNGVSVRVVFGYDQDTKKDTISFDILYGISTLNENLACRLIG